MMETRTRWFGNAVFHSSAIRQSSLKEGSAQTTSSKHGNLREMSYSMSSALKGD